MEQSAQQTSATNKKQVVMVSSTARDLPEHRNQIKDGCLRQGMFPLMMEHLPAIDADAIAASLHMVDEADIYLGVFAFRYGYIPQGHTISITEMEYNRAVERGIPRLIFLMHEKHPITVADIERGEGATKLETLKTRLQQERVVNYFTSPIDLLAKVINSLSQYRQSDLSKFHYVSDIPQPPKEYIAHPYTLLQTSTLIGRQAELNLLTDWVTNPRSELYPARILSIVAIGGMGKSALTWKWFHDIAPHEMQPLAGRMWWSFYESDASFENFVIRALAYVSRRPKQEVQALPSLEREAQLLALLDQEPYLIVLDGLERLLLAYARLDASRLADEDLDQQTANRVTGALGLPESAAHSFIGQHLLRKTADPRIGNFLRKLATVRTSRILVSTRLYPADLQTETGRERFGCKALFLPGLADDDALNLWRIFEVSGSRETLLPLFYTFGNHPLLIQALAGVVAHDRRTPGDFDQWQKNHPSFNPFQLSLIQARSHVLATALKGLDKVAEKVLFTVAAFRMPTSYDTLVALFVGQDKPFAHEDGLVSILEDLEDRGLLGWDRRANRYDLHPIVRGVTWSKVGKDAKQSIYEELNTHFASLPSVEEDDVKSLDDLAPTIELYNALIGLERFDDALQLFSNNLFGPMLGPLSAPFQMRELLRAVFSLETNWWLHPNLSDLGSQATSLLFLAMSTLNQPKQAAEIYKQFIELAIEFVENRGNKGFENISFVWAFTAEQLCLSGSLYEAEVQALQSVLLSQKSSDTDFKIMALSFLGLTLAVRGKYEASEKVFKRTLASIDEEYEPLSHDCNLMYTLWSGQYTRAYALAQVARTKYQQYPMLGRHVRALWFQGVAALEISKELEAEECLHEAMAQARALSLVSEELPARVGLAELRRRQGDLRAAREFLEEVWEPAERGSFRLYHADACNVLAQIERDAGNHEAAIQAARKAYQLAWCDGPPYAYEYGLRKAKAHLAALGAPEPDLPPFDASGREPIPEVDIEQILRSEDEQSQ